MTISISVLITNYLYILFLSLDLLDSLVEWVIKHDTICRPKDLVSLCITLAILNYKTTHAEQLKSKLLPNINPEEIGSASEWLNYIWALTVLEIADSNHIESALG